MFWILLPVIWYRRWVPLISGTQGVSDSVVEGLAKALEESGLRAEIYVAEDGAAIGREVYVVAKDLTPSMRVDVLRAIYRVVPPMLVPAIHVMDMDNFKVVKMGIGDRLKKVWPR